MRISRKHWDMINQVRVLLKSVTGEVDTPKAIWKLVYTAIGYISSFFASAVLLKDLTGFDKLELLIKGNWEIVVIVGLFISCLHNRKKVNCCKKVSNRDMQIAISVRDIFQNRTANSYIIPIFYMYLYGYSTQQIADTLTNQARSTYFGKSCWSSSGIVSILRNERHCGDVLTRKTVTENYRTHRTLKNRGEKPQSRYYNHHDAIIRRDDFNAVQRMLDNAKYGNKSILPELRVIHDGLLKGFVSINPRWSGFKEGDYLSASRSAYTDIPTAGAPSQIPADATFAVNAGDFDLRGFEITRTEFLGTHSQPFVTFADKKVKFSAACVRHFGAKRYVELLINPLEMKFAVRPTDSSNRSGVIISSNYSGKPQPREISAAAFSDTIFHLFGWNTACKYRINGILCEDAGQLVYIFDVADSETFIRSQELSVRAASTNEETIHPLSTLGKHVRAIPEQWVGTFGKEFYLHECSLSALEHMTRSNWSLNLQGQLFETGKKLHVTDFDELRQYIMKELGGTMPQEDRNGNME